MTVAQLLLDATVRSSLVLAGALVAVFLLRRRSAALRHWVLAGSLLAAAAAPVVAFTLPSSWRLPLDRVPIVRAVTSPDPAPAVAPSPGKGRGGTRPGVPAAEPRRMTIAAIAAVVWLAGAAAGLTILLVGLARLASVTSRSRPMDDARWSRWAQEVSREYGLGRAPVVLQSDRAALPVTWGTFRSVVIVPRAAHEWDDERIRIVLGHELAHVRRGDWLTQIAAEIVRAAYWFTPLAGSCRAGSASKASRPPTISSWTSASTPRLTPGTSWISRAASRRGTARGCRPRQSSGHRASKGELPPC